jgi:CHASE2 domain-containing sensor protein
MDPPLSYLNLDLWVLRDPAGSYSVRGAARQEDVQDQAVGDPATLGARDQQLLGNTAGLDYIKALGIRQYRFLFRTANGARIQSLLDRCQGEAGQECGVRIRLRQADSNPEIAAIPWEFLYTEVFDSFVASSETTPIVRFVQSPKPPRPPEARLPLNLLVVIPAAQDLDLDGEKRRILEALEGITPPVTPTFLEDTVTRQRLSDALQNESIDFLHFVGHGDVKDGRGCLRLNLNEFDADWIDDQAMGELVSNRRALKLVVLNSCQGAGASSADAFAGVAPQLVRAGVPAVVAMQFPIRDDEALVFVHAFYHALFQGIGKGSVDAAITAARSALSREFRGTRAIGLPVLFMRYNEGVLFQVVDEKGTKPETKTRQDVAREAAIQRETAAAIERIEQQPAGSTDAGTPEELTETREMQARSQSRLRYLRRAIVTPVVIVFLVILTAAGGLFERVPLTWIAAASPVWFGDPLAATLPVDSIALVTTQEIIDSTWRPRHAELLAKLSAAGARVVAFDVRFRAVMPDDATLAAAVAAARARGTAVVGGSNRLEGDSLALAPALVNQVATGIDCLGENPLQFSGIVPLLWSRGGARGRMLPSFALSVVKAWRGATSTVDPSGREVALVDRDQVVDRVKLTRLTSLLLSQPKCPIMTAGSRYGELLAVRAPLGEWRDPVRRFDYAAVLASPAQSLAWARGKIVLVGGAVAADLARRRVGFRTDKRYGVERHADAIATILGNAEVVPLGRGVEYLIVAGLAGLGALLASLGPRPKRRRAVLLALAVLFGLALLSTALYWSGHRLMNLLYPLLAFLLTFTILLRFRRRWLL